MTDEQIIAAFKADDTESLGFLWEKYHKKLKRYARKNLEDDFFIEDVVVDAFLKVWRNRACFMTGRTTSITGQVDYKDLVDKIRGYLYVAVRSKCVDLYKRKILYGQVIRKYLLIQAVEGNDYNDGMEYEVSYVDKVRQIENAILLLPEKSRQVFEFYYFQQLSYQEIALLLDITAQSVRNLKGYAILLIRAATQGVHRTEVRKAS